MPNRTIARDHRNFRHAMTVAQMIEALQEMEPNAIPLFVCDYGDYHHTQQALPVVSIDPCYDEVIVESAYSKSQMAIEPRGQGDDEYEEDGSYAKELQAEINHAAENFVIMRM